MKEASAALWVSPDTTLFKYASCSQNKQTNKQATKHQNKPKKETKNLTGNGNDNFPSVLSIKSQKFYSTISISSFFSPNAPSLAIFKDIFLHNT